MKNRQVEPNSKAHHALRLSIGKWLELERNPRVEDFDSDSCALCKAFWNYTDRCKHCPLTAAGFGNCAATPFMSYDAAAYAAFFDGGKERANLSKIARREVEFLKTFLPDSDPLKTSRASAPVYVSKPIKLL